MTDKSTTRIKTRADPDQRGDLDISEPRLLSYLNTEVGILITKKEQ